MYRWVRPKVSIPVHGELRHLAEHVKLAKSLQVPDALLTPNGAMVQLAPGAPRVIDHVPTGRLYVDGDLLIPSDDGTVAQRRKISFSGHVIALIVLDHKGRLAADPRIAAQGLPQGVEGEIDDKLLGDMEEELALAIDAMPKPQARDDDAVEEQVRRSIRKVLKESWGKKPVISVEIVRLED
jgi:ribonuclease J